MYSQHKKINLVNAGVYDCLYAKFNTSCISLYAGKSLKQHDNSCSISNLKKNPQEYRDHRSQVTCILIEQKRLDKNKSSLTR